LSPSSACPCFFFFPDPATPAIYTLSYTTLFRSGEASERDGRPSPRGAPRSRHAPRLHRGRHPALDDRDGGGRARARGLELRRARSEEHTSELQSLAYLVCRLLLEKKKKKSSAVV